MKIEIKNDICVAIPKGRIDTFQASNFEKEIIECIEKKHSTKLVIDFSEVSYICSKGLRVLFIAQDKIDKGLAISSLNDLLQQAFTKTGLSNTFAIHGTKEEAIKALKLKT